MESPPQVSIRPDDQARVLALPLCNVRIFHYTIVSLEWNLD